MNRIEFIARKYMETDLQLDVASNSVDLTVSNLAGSIYASSEFFRMQTVLYSASLLIFAVLVTDPGEYTNPNLPLTRQSSNSANR